MDCGAPRGDCLHRLAGPRAAEAGSASIRAGDVAGSDRPGPRGIAATRAHARGQDPARVTQGAAPRRSVAKKPTTTRAGPYGITMTEVSRVLAGRRGLSRLEKEA